MSTLANALSHIPDTLQLLLQKFNAHAGNLHPGIRNLLLSGAALAIFLRLCFGGKRSKGYVSSLNKVGRCVAGAIHADLRGQYDVIVVGGGR